jgi:hypothetical protein
MLETIEGSIMPAVLPVETHPPETDKLDTYIGGNGSFDFGGGERTVVRHAASGNRWSILTGLYQFHNTVCRLR